MDNKTYNFEFKKALISGANPHQEANLYHIENELNYEILSDRELTYNNFINASKALEISSEFFDVAACVVVKYENPCAVALSSDINNAWDKVIDSDPISVFDGAVAFTREVSAILANKLKDMSLNMVIAPRYEQKALEILKKNKNLTILKINTNLEEISKITSQEIKFTPFGVLIQTKDTKDFDVNTFKVVTKKKPEQKELEDMIFAYKIVKHIKSAGIVIAKDLRTIGISSGMANRIDAVEVALNKVCDSAKGAIVASDDALNSIDNIQSMAQNRIAGVIQPMGSNKDGEIIVLADKYEISMVSTNITHLS